MSNYTDYLLLLSPPENIRHEIDRYKRATARLIGEYPSMKSPAHISINQMPRQKPTLIEPSIARLEPKLQSMPPILLHLDGFKFFEHLHNKFTVYAAIRSTTATGNWFDLLNKNLGIKKALVPHITVARDITSHQFDELWPIIKHKKVTEPFMINELTILRRETFGPRTWKPYKVYPFKNAITLGTVEKKSELF